MKTNSSKPNKRIILTKAPVKCLENHARHEIKRQTKELNSQIVTPNDISLIVSSFEGRAVGSQARVTSKHSSISTATCGDFYPSKLIPAPTIPLHNIQWQSLSSLSFVFLPLFRTSSTSNPFFNLYLRSKQNGRGVRTKLRLRDRENSQEKLLWFSKYLCSAFPKSN